MLVTYFSNLSSLIMFDLLISYLASQKKRIKKKISMARRSGKFVQVTKLNNPTGSVMSFSFYFDFSIFF